MVLEDIVLKLESEADMAAFKQAMSSVSEFGKLVKGINISTKEMGIGINQAMNQIKVSTINSTNAIIKRLELQSSLMKEAAVGVSEDLSGVRTPNLTNIGQGIADNLDTANARTRALSKEYANLEKQSNLAAKNGLNNLYNSLMKTDNLLNKKSVAGFKNIDDVLKDINKQIKPAKQEFAGWAMSIMFFGMALQRIFGSIWKSSTKMFQDVMHSTTGAITNFDLMQGSLKYLQFTVGEALEPIIGYLIPIVDWVQSLVEMFPKLTAVIIATGITLGGIFTVGGSGVLAINGFLELATKIGLASKNADDLLRMDWSKLGKGLGAAIGIGYSLYLLDQAYEDLKAGNILSATGETVFAGGVLAATFGNKNLGGALIAIGAAIQLTDAFIEGHGKLTKDSFAKFMVQLGGGLIFINPAVGAAMLTVGFVISFVDDGSFAIIIERMGRLFAVLLDVLTLVFKPFYNMVATIVNSLVYAYNLIQKARGKSESDFEMPTYGVFSFTEDWNEKVATLHDEIAKGIADEEMRANYYANQAKQDQYNQLYGQSTATPQFFFEITLDGDQIANKVTPKVSSDVMNWMDTYNTGG